MSNCKKSCKAIYFMICFPSDAHMKRVPEMDIVFVCGFVAKPPEEKFNQNTGKKSARVIIGVKEKYTDHEGNLKEKVIWENCMFRGKAADTILQYVEAGSLNFAVVGQRNRYEHNGKWYEYINVDKFDLPVPRSWLKEREGTGTNETSAPNDLPPAPDLDDEIPF